MVTRELYKTAMAMLQNVYGFEMNKELFETYYSVISSEMDDNKFKESVANIMKSFKPTSQVKFPLVPDFLEAVNLTGTSRAKEVINDLKYAVRRFGRYDSINLGDSKMHQTIKFYGGWIKICNWTEEDWKFQEKSFIETYNVMRPDPDHSYVRGLHEVSNTGRYKIAPPQKVYLTMKKKPVEELEYRPIESGKIEHIQPVKALADKMGLDDIF